MGETWFTATDHKICTQLTQKSSCPLQHVVVVDNLQRCCPNVFADVFGCLCQEESHQNFVRPYSKPTPAVTRIVLLKILDALVQNRPPAVLNPSKKNVLLQLQRFSHFVFDCLLVPSFNSGRNLTYTLFLDLPPLLRNHL